MLLVLGTISSPVRGLLYILVFGIGSTGGMLVLSGLIGIPFALTEHRSRAAHATIEALAGAASLILGLALAVNLAITAFDRASAPEASRVHMDSLAGNPEMVDRVMSKAVSLRRTPL